ncbi:hypothetical protein QE152_g41 [Popillia japonica]|uniref:Uncharacterized protein n=1 Tax=Popillia japonica TaxID=7064 RepID=A0AAW1NL16_POPJA
MMILFVSKHILKLIFTQLNKLCLNPDDNSRRTLKGKIEAFKELAAICQELFELVSAFKSMVSLTVLFIFGECFAFMIFKIFSCSRLVYDLGLAEFSASVSKIVLVHALTLQLSHENYKITAGGFFVIDLELLFSANKVKPTLRSLETEGNGQKVLKEVDFQ